MSEIDNGSEDLINRVDLINHSHSNEKDYININLPLKENVCRKCPNAVWHYKNKNIFCHCRVMNTIEYSSKIDINIKFCTGSKIN